MKRDKEIELLGESLTLMRERRRPATAEEALVPVSDYTDPARFERELACVFRRELNVVALSTDVAGPGDFVRAGVLGAPALVVRGTDGQLRAFLNVCRHRGATVELRPAGRCERFVCPYHAWTYDTDGALRRARHPEGFPTLVAAEHGLVELPCVERAGLVFVCPTPGAAPPALPSECADELTHVLGLRPTAYASYSRVVAANWKLIVEGGIESYHFSVAHKDTIAPFFTDTSSTWERIGAHTRQVLPKRSLQELDAIPSERWRIRDHTHIVYSLHPNAMVLLQKSHFDLILMTPLAVDSTRITVLSVGVGQEDPALATKAKQFMQRNHEFTVLTLEEDFVLGEQIQRGIATGANTHFRFGGYEGALTDFRRHLEAELARSSDAPG